MPSYLSICELPRASSSGQYAHTVTSEYSISRTELDADLIPRMCTQILGFFPCTERFKTFDWSHDWDKRAVGMLFHVCLQVPCPRHWWTETVCSRRCEEEFPSPRIANWTFSPAESLEETLDCFRSARDWLPWLEDTINVEGIDLSKYSVATFLSRLPSFGTLIVLEEHKEVWDFVSGLVRETMTQAVAEVDRSPQAEISYRKAYAVAYILHALLSSVPANDLPSSLLTRIGIPEAEFHPRLRALLERLLSHTFFSDCMLVSPDDLVADVLFRVGGPLWHENARYLDTYLPLWNRMALRALVSHRWHWDPANSWRRPSDNLEKRLVRLMACKRLFGLHEASSTEDEVLDSGDHVEDGSESAALSHAHDAQCAAATRIAIAELQLRFWSSKGRGEGDPAPDYVLNCLSQSLSQLQDAEMDTMRRHLEELDNHVNYFILFCEELIARDWVQDGDRPATEEHLLKQFKEVETTISRMLRHE